MGKTYSDNGLLLCEPVDAETDADAVAEADPEEVTGLATTWTSLMWMLWCAGCPPDSDWS